MFQTPTRSSTRYERPANIDLDERYIFTLVKLEDEGISKFADPAKGENFHNIRWEFNVAHAESKTAIYDSEGARWVFIDYTTSKTGRNPSNGNVAKARLWIEALLGHQVEDDEITADLPSKLVNRYAAGFFEEKDRQSQDGSTYQRLQIMRLTNYKKGDVEAAAPPPPPPPPKVDDNELPF